MKILKLLNNKSFSILCCFFIFFSQNLSAEDDPVDIWNLDEMPKKKLSLIMIKPKKKILIKVKFMKHNHIKPV